MRAEGQPMRTAPQVPESTKVPCPAYLTPDEVADVLRLSTKSIYRLAKDNPDMPVLKIGGTVRFPRERLERWLRDREQGRPRTRSLSAVAPNPASGQEGADA
jgi:excisionase family DNA binding protein